MVGSIPEDGDGVAARAVSEFGDDLATEVGEGDFAAKQPALSLGIDTNDRTPDNNMYMHLGVPHLGRWQLGVTYSRGTADDFADLWDFGLTDNDLLIAQTRYGVADWLHLNLEALTVYGIGARSVFESQLQVNFSAEFGFSY